MLSIMRAAMVACVAGLAAGRSLRDATVDKATAVSAAPTTKNIVQLAQSVPELSILVELVVAADLASPLSGPGPFTVFAPTNKAFEALGNKTLQSLLDPANIALLQSILEYHLVSGAVYSTDLFDGETVATVSSQLLNVSISHAHVFINDALVLQANVNATNGVVHIVDTVLIPPAAPQPSPAPAPAATTDIVDLAESVPELSTLVDLIIAGNLAEQLSGTGPFTVFAPTNAAFSKLGNATIAHLTDPANVLELRTILFYHVIAGSAVFSNQLYDGESVASAEGAQLDVHVSGATITIDSSKVIKADVAATNGVVHLVDTVLIPPRDVWFLAQSTDNLSILCELVTAAGLQNVLVGQGPLTVFAPTNDAFEILGDATLHKLLDPANVALLRDILTYHVAPNSYLTADLVDGTTISTAEGNIVTVHKTGSTVEINDALIVTKDVTAQNGVVQVIDRVLMPPSASPTPSPSTGNPNIVQLAESVPNLSILVKLIVAANIQDALSTGGPYTVFAPTNAAFNALGPAKLKYLEDPAHASELLAILEYHVAMGSVYSSQLYDGEVITTTEGETVQVSIKGTSVYINNAIVQKADNTASNGVVHIISQVLLPK